MPKMKAFPRFHIDDAANVDDPGEIQTYRNQYIHSYAINVRIKEVLYSMNMST